MYIDKHLLQDKRSKAGIFLLSFLLLITLAAGATLAYLTAQDAPMVNIFTPSFVDCTVKEEFDGNIKSNVNVTNTGDTEAYIRVKLVTYRVNDDGDHIGGTALIPNFNLGENWVQHGDYYYYTLPVQPGGVPAASLIDRITLKDAYTDADGGKQVIEVMAEAIQSGPKEAVGRAWGVSISEGKVDAYSENQGGAGE